MASIDQPKALRMIRHTEAHNAIEIHFVKNEEEPTGLAEPLFPPVIAALANSLYRATGRRNYNPPLVMSWKLS